MTSGRGFIDARLRANPNLELIPLDRLSDGERAVVVQHDAEDDLWGVLRSRDDPGSGLRTASADVALLFFTLTSPSVLPQYARRRLGSTAERTIRRLVLDGVLEVEHEGRFLTSVAAGDLLDGAGAKVGRGRIGTLSEAALRHGQELTDLPPGTLAMRLYGYGTSPLSPSRRRRLGNAGAVAVACGLGPGTATAKALAAGWTESSAPAGDGAPWRSWRTRRGSEGPTRHKLYVSPTVAAVPDAVEAVAGELAKIDGACAFKVGRDARGLCRPDKLMAYFESLDALRAGSEALGRRLAGCPAQGVPFTAAITEDGLLSWGVDPPAGKGSGTSWRMWVADRLADYLIQAAAPQQGRSALAPWRLAVERLALDGVDTDRWIPSARMYEE